MKKKNSKSLQEYCSICGNSSGYDKESLEASTHEINGTEIIICCPCEDDLFRLLVSKRINFEKITNILEETTPQCVIDDVIEEIKGDYWEEDDDDNINNDNDNGEIKNEDEIIVIKTTKKNLNRVEKILEEKLLDEDAADLMELIKGNDIHTPLDTEYKDGHIIRK